MIWNGKTRDATNIVLPFQVIEQVDEPRKIQPLMDANTRESGKTIRVYSRFKIIRTIQGIAYLIIDSVLKNG